MNQLGLAAAMNAVRLGRSSFFGDGMRDLPKNRQPEVAAFDSVAQFGFVGSAYEQHRLLLLGINPGNGLDDTVSLADREMLPLWRAFHEKPSETTWQHATAAYLRVCETWPVWGRHCADLLRSVGMTTSDIAYSNCLPWRTASKSSFADDIAERTAANYVRPLLQELAPRIVVAVGKRAAAIIGLADTGVPILITWNRAQALTSGVAAERRAAKDELQSALARGRTLL